MYREFPYLEGQLGDTLAQSLDRRRGACVGEAGEYDHQLLAAVAAEPVVLPDGAGKTMGQFAQHLVTAVVAVGVVDVFEMVDVDQGERERRAGALRVGELASQY